VIGQTCWPDFRIQPVEREISEMKVHSSFMELLSVSNLSAVPEPRGSGTAEVCYAWHLRSGIA